MTSFRTIRSAYADAVKAGAHPLDALNQMMATFYDYHFGGRLDRILGFDSNAKTVKGQGRGYLTGILYLAPADTIPGLNSCPMAKRAGCINPCLNKAGRGAMDGTQAARIRKTLWFYLNPAGFFAMLRVDILTLQCRAMLADADFAIRLNGTSDIMWERVKDPTTGRTILELFPDVVFYDYTKIPGRTVPANYHLTYSYSAATPAYRKMAEQVIAETTMNVAVVFAGSTLPATWAGRPVINGDADDLRFLDPAGVIVGLTAKGPAKKDTSGFVVTL